MISLGALTLAAAVATASATPPPMAERIDAGPGVENVGRVAPGLYRGSRPTSAGLDALQKLGIKTIINLRHYHGTSEEAGCRRRGIDYVRIVTASSREPRDEDVRKFLEIVTNPARQPVYFHCWRGKDRTGVMAAAYRMAVQGWTLDQAVAEMDAFGFYRGWRSLRRYTVSIPDRMAQLRAQPPPAPLPAPPTAP
jgi:tyrosine-protein phosphatase SIW14